MPRTRRPSASSRKATRRSPSGERDVLLSKLNSRQSLERMLEGVVMPPDPREEARAVPEPVPAPIPTVEVTRITSQEIRQDQMRQADMTLVEAMRRPPSGPRRIKVEQGTHEPSPHEAMIASRASRIEQREREPIMASVDDWSAPFETPPSLEALESLAGDLCVPHCDPRLFLPQFTPATADLAWAERYAWWRQIRAPFIRWVPVGREASGASAGVRSVSEGEEKRTSVFARLWHRVDEEVIELKHKEEEIITGIEESWGVPVMVPRLAPMRVLAGFAVLFLVVSLPALAVSFGNSLNRSWVEVQEAGASVSEGVGQALGSSVPSVQALSDVSSRLRRADQALGRVSAIAVALAEAVPATRNRYAAARSLIRAGELSTQAATLLRQGMDRALAAQVTHPVERLDAFRTYLSAALPLVDEAAALASRADPEDLPEELRSSVAELSSMLGAAQGVLRESDAMTSLLAFVAGKQETRTYLLVFQNTAELRPSGGFMGSVAEITVDRGEIKRVRVPGGGPYDLRSELREHVAPPGPLQLIASRWEFQDANWFPDFAATADKIRWFWSRSGQPTLDGVVAVNSTLLEKLLAFTGPIEMPEYGKTLTAENVLFETQKAVELEYDKTENAPKKIIGDLFPLVLKQLREVPAERAPELLAVFADSLRSKDIQIWLTRPEEQEQVTRFGWLGRLAPSSGDALAIVEANIAGQKTDTSIDENVLHEVEISEDGSIIDTVTLTRTHKASKGELFRGVNNVSYVRFYVPEGSELLAAEGFHPPSQGLFKNIPPEEGQDPHLASLIQPQGQSQGLHVTREFGRTAFGGWLQLEPGVTSVTKIRYRLPMTAFDITRRLNPADGSASGRPAYLGLLTSQSGKPGRTLESRVTYPEQWRVAWPSPDASTLSTPWDRDRAFALLFDLPHEEAR